MSGLVSGRRGRRRSRRQRNLDASAEQDEPIVLDDSVIDDNVTSCIDLTETADDEFVDLTSSQTPVLIDDNSYGANDSSVVILGDLEDSLPAHRRRLEDRLPTIGDSSDEDLPVVPIKVPKPNTPRPNTSSGCGSSILSPEGNLISCPICLDDVKTIKKNNDKLATVSCGHVFCRKCIQQAVQQNGCCPMCRKKLKKNNIVVLHV
ncbi:E3 ubiquitin-protein ligase rnf4 [Mactra antiquata]